MKHILFLVLVMCCLGCFSQQQMSSPDDYLRKGRKLGTAGWILAGSGVTMVAAGTIIAIHTDWDALDYDDNSYGRNETIKGAGAIALIGTGVIASIGSIPLFIMSASNKRRAASLSVSTQRYETIMQRRTANLSMPAVTLRVRL
jgi:hypothetical protein